MTYARRYDIIVVDQQDDVPFWCPDKYKGEMIMKKENFSEQTPNDSSEKNKFVLWIKEHKVELLLASVSITTLLVTILGIKYKETIAELWCTLLDKGDLLSDKWFSKASLEELQTTREMVQNDYCNPDLDLDYREKCWNLLQRFDNAISKIRWQGKEYGYPVHSEHGWYLSSDE